jgi:hypothetical protein
MITEVDDKFIQKWRNLASMVCEVEKPAAVHKDNISLACSITGI